MSLLRDKGGNRWRTVVAGPKMAADKQEERSEFWIIFEARANGFNKLNTRCDKKQESKVTPEFASLSSCKRGIAIFLAGRRWCGRNRFAMGEMQRSLLGMRGPEDIQAALRVHSLKSRECGVQKETLGSLEFKGESELEIDIWQLAESRWHLKLEWTQLVDVAHCAVWCFKKRICVPLDGSCNP